MLFVFLTIFQNTEPCPHCSSKGLDKKLRYFYLSLEEAIYKCENETCLYPFDHFIFKRLSDNKIYYYEEIKDNGREVFLRVPLDGQSINQSINPLSTKLICDSQRNPDIESYDCDFSDLFDVIDFEPIPETPKPSTSTDENPDFLEFINDVTPCAETSTDRVLDENGVIDVINSVLSESPLKTATPTKPSTSTNTAPEATLSKCIKHIEKVKNVRNYKINQKSQETFAAALKKARTGPNQTASTPSVEVKSEPETKAKLKPKQITQALSMMRSTLRPTELASRLKSMDISKTNSNFLRQYMKTKEEKLFAEEPPDPRNIEGMPKRNLTALPIVTNPTTSRPSTISRPATVSVTSTITSDSAVEYKAPAEPVLKKKGPKPKKSTKKEPTDGNAAKEPIPKKVTKPRITKKINKSTAEPVADSTQLGSAVVQQAADTLQAVIVHQSTNETVPKDEGSDKSKTKEISLTKRKRAPAKEKTTEGEPKNESTIKIEPGTTQSKRKSRKASSSTASNDAPNGAKVATDVKVETDGKSSKRSRKPKKESDNSKLDHVIKKEPPPKRRRIKKETSIQSELMSLPIVFDEKGK